MRVHETVQSEANWSSESPCYRVNFWQKSGESWALDAYILTEVKDVVEALRWAEENRHGRSVEVFVETEDEPISEFTYERKAALVRVFGENPNEGVTSSIRKMRQDPGACS